MSTTHSIAVWATNDADPREGGEYREYERTEVAADLSDANRLLRCAVQRAVDLVRERLATQAVVVWDGNINAALCTVTEGLDPFIPGIEWVHPERAPISSPWFDEREAITW